MRKWWKLLGVILFPITLMIFILKLICRILDKYKSNKFTHDISVSRLDNLDGREFEDFLFLIFQQSGIKVTKTKTTGDYGADLILDIHGLKIAIQCKLYYKHSVGNGAIQEVLGAIDYYKCDAGLVITNSKFTKSAIIQAKESQVNIMDRLELEKFLKLGKYQKIEYLKSLETKNWIYSFTEKSMKLIKN